MNLEDAERRLLGLETFGVRLGLHRMRRLLAELGDPQRRFPSIHVVGTNGKSSTVRMTAAILRRHGLRAGAYLSPHLVSFAERVRVDDEDVDGAATAEAVHRALDAAEAVETGLEAGDHVTQFEVLTAAAFDHLARADVDAAVVEAGLGGRLDATNVLPSRVQVLTNVSLEHTRLLGSTVRAIAEQKLAVVQPGATLVVGAGLHPDALAVAEEVAAERGARLVVAPPDADLPPGAALAARGDFQRRNLAVAAEAARAFLGRLDAAALRAAAETVAVPGRFEVVDPADGGATVVLDGAHNPAGIAALAEALPAFVGGRRLVACVAVLRDKDAAAMLRELLPLCDAVVATAAHSPRALPAADVERAARVAGFGGAVEVVDEPRAALEHARALAGPGGVALATGSIYLVADLLRPADRVGSTL
ncbi:MAG TPA: cyanophycin synthetase [Baekduia sp.]|nr:cyanophycin synthetase [Baekduia sp.]